MRWVQRDRDACRYTLLCAADGLLSLIRFVSAQSTRAGENRVKRTASDVENSRGNRNAAPGRDREGKRGREPTERDEHPADGGGNQIGARAGDQGFQPRRGRREQRDGENGSDRGNQDDNTQGNERKKGVFGTRRAPVER